VFASDVFLAEVDPGSERWSSRRSGSIRPALAEPRRGSRGRPTGGRWRTHWFLNSQATLVVHDMNTGEDRELSQANQYNYVSGWFPAAGVLAGKQAHRRDDRPSGVHSPPGARAGNAPRDGHRAVARWQERLLLRERRRRREETTPVTVASFDTSIGERNQHSSPLFGFTPRRVADDRLVAFARLERSPMARW